MGTVIPRPAIRARESRRIIAALSEYESTHTFTVIDLTTGDDHGRFETLERALGCVEFDRLAEYQIWYGDVLFRCVEFEALAPSPSPVSAREERAA